MRYREEWGKGYDFLFGAAAWRGKNKSNLVNINLIHCFHSVFFLNSVSISLPPSTNIF